MIAIGIDFEKMGGKLQWFIPPLNKLKQFFIEYPRLCRKNNKKPYLLYAFFIWLILFVAFLFGDCARMGF